MVTPGSNVYAPQFSDAELRGLRRGGPPGRTAGAGACARAERRPAGHQRRCGRHRALHLPHRDRRGHCPIRCWLDVVSRAGITVDLTLGIDRSARSPPPDRMAPGHQGGAGAARAGLWRPFGRTRIAQARRLRELRRPAWSPAPTPAQPRPSGTAAPGGRSWSSWPLDTRSRSACHRNVRRGGRPRPWRRHRASPSWPGRGPSRGRRRPVDGAGVARTPARRTGAWRSGLLIHRRGGGRARLGACRGRGRGGAQLDLRHQQQEEEGDAARLLRRSGRPSPSTRRTRLEGVRQRRGQRLDERRVVLDLRGRPPGRRSGSRRPLRVGFGDDGCCNAGVWDVFSNSSAMLPPTVLNRIDRNTATPSVPPIWRKNVAELVATPISDGRHGALHDQQQRLHAVAEPEAEHEHRQARPAAARCRRRGVESSRRPIDQRAPSRRSGRRRMRPGPGDDLAGDRSTPVIIPSTIGSISRPASVGEAPCTICM